MINAVRTSQTDVGAVVGTLLGCLIGALFIIGDITIVRKNKITLLIGEEKVKILFKRALCLVK